MYLSLIFCHFIHCWPPKKKKCALTCSSETCKSSVKTWKTDSFEFVELNFGMIIYNLLVFRLCGLFKNGWIWRTQVDVLSFRLQVSDTSQVYFCILFKFLPLSNFNPQISKSDYEVYGNIHFESPWRRWQSLGRGHLQCKPFTLMHFPTNQ